MEQRLKSDVRRAGLEARLHDKGGSIVYKPRPQMLRATHVSDDKIEIVPRQNSARPQPDGHGPAPRQPR